MMYRNGERVKKWHLNMFILLLKWPLFEPKMPTVQCGVFRKSTPLLSSTRTGSTFKKSISRQFLAYRSATVCSFTPFSLSFYVFFCCYFGKWWWSHCFRSINYCPKTSLGKVHFFRNAGNKSNQIRRSIVMLKIISTAMRLQ